MDSPIRLAKTSRHAQSDDLEGTTRRGFFAYLLALFTVPALPPRASATPAPSVTLGVFPVAGFRFHDGPEVIADLRVGDAVELVPEPHNPHDERAIRVQWRGAHLGYVPRRDNSVPASLLADGRHLRGTFTKVRPEAMNPWGTLAFEIRLDLKPSDSRGAQVGG